jgi:N-formylglutamate deformylase
VADGFKVVAPTGAARSVIAHVPHASTTIPADIRADILLSNAELQAELVRMTDWHTDELFAGARTVGATMFINRTTRLVIDPERFVDDGQEPMARVGQGVVYERTSMGELLRTPDRERRAELIATYFTPYHAALTELSRRLLEAQGRCLIIDCHSFATHALPSEPDQSPDRPDVCIGTDAFHTPRRLVDAAVETFEQAGLRVDVDRPFRGALVPLDFYAVDERVSAVMIEVRRGLYCDETSGTPSSDFGHVRALVGSALNDLISVAGL